mmetsp:Transcript_15734/g.59865  ORF Transcript_15734/g.59865 Transcript_15734/m.59865 type:complete len:442 (-) Transcript_15734:9-1334(-)
MLGQHILDVGKPLHKAARHPTKHASRAEEVVGSRTPAIGPSVVEEGVNHGDLVVADARVLEPGLDRRQVPVCLVSQRVEHAQAQLLAFWNQRVIELAEEHVQVEAVVIIAGQHLLQLGAFQEAEGLHFSTELRQDGHVLLHRVGLRLESWISIQEALHVFDGADVLVQLSLCLELLEQALDGYGEVAVVGVPMIAEELILRRAQNDFVELRLHARRILENHPIVRQAQYLVHHSLVGPLGEQRSDRIVLAIEDQKKRPLHSSSHAAEVEHVVRVNRHGDFIRNLARDGAPGGVAYLGRLPLQTEQHAEDAAHCPRKGFRPDGVVRPAESDGVGHGQAEEVLVDRLKVPIVLVNLPDQVVLVCARKALQRIALDDVAEEDVILRVFRLGQLPLEQLNVVRGGLHEHRRLQVAHGFVRSAELFDQVHLLLEDLALRVHHGAHV